MYQYTFENHLKFGYNGQAFNDRSDPSDIWTVNYGKCKNPPLSFRKECIRAANLIKVNAEGQEIVVFLSGGIDSEMALRSFLDAKIKVKVIICRYNDDLNIHDISWAVILCNKYEVDYYIFDVNLANYWDGDMWEYAKFTKIVGVSLSVKMHVIDQVDGLPIIAAGNCYFVKRIPETKFLDYGDPGLEYRKNESDEYISGAKEYPKSPWDLWERERMFIDYRFFIHRDRPGIPGFYHYTPELLLSYALDPTVIDLVNDKRIGKYDTVSSKFDIASNYFDLMYRPTYTGYEKVGQKILSEYRKKLEPLYNNYNEIYKIEYNDFIGRLSPEN